MTQQYKGSFIYPQTHQTFALLVSKPASSCLKGSCTGKLIQT